MKIPSIRMISRPKKWPDEKSVKLIRAFRSKPVLWDSQSRMQYKKEERLAMWNEITIEMNSSLANCKNKIVNLMSGFRREKSKILRLMAGVTGNWNEDLEYKLRYGWYAFKELGFLLFKDIERNRIQSEQPIDVFKDYVNLKQALLDSLAKRNKRMSGSSEEDSQDVIEIKQDESSSFIKTETGPQWPIKRNSPVSEVFEETYSNEVSLDSPEPSSSQGSAMKLKRNANSDSHEEIKYFANFIASKMKNYSETTKNAVQKDICEIIFKADQHYYETISNDDFVVYDPENECKKAKKQ